ncbi:MAG: hypothetical protein ACRESZ_09710 [Methylococcales bacterium]
MNAKSQDTRTLWVDRDDAPEVTEADLDRDEWFIGGVQITSEEAKVAFGEMLGKKTGQPIAGQRSRVRCVPCTAISNGPTTTD